MHPSAQETARRFFEKYWTPEYQVILEFGAMNINGSLRDLCPPVKLYYGLDLEDGPGVDMVVKQGGLLQMRDGHWDMVLSSSQLEHDPMFWQTFLEMARLVRIGGLIYINAPSVYKVHRHPMDYWRFNLDSAMALEMWATTQGYPLDLIEANISAPDAEGQTDFSAVFLRI